MSARPRPRGQSVLTGSMILIVGLAGLASVDVGISIAFTAFALCLIVAALECRSETGTVFTTATFDSKQMNRAILAEFGARCAGDADGRLPPDARHHRHHPCTVRMALVPPLALLLWEIGKFVARRTGTARGADAG